MEINNTTNSVLTGLLILVQIMLFDKEIITAAAIAMAYLPLVYLSIYVIIKLQNFLNNPKIKK